MACGTPDLGMAVALQLSLEDRRPWRTHERIVVVSVEGSAQLEWRAQGQRRSAIGRDGHRIGGEQQRAVEEEGWVRYALEIDRTCLERLLAGECARGIEGQPGGDRGRGDRKAA